MPDALDGQNELSIRDAASEHTKMRNREKSGSPIEERTVFIKKLISTNVRKWLDAQQETCALDIDSIGLWLRAGPSSGDRGVHSHVRFEDMDLPFLRAIRDQQLLPGSEITELAARVAEKILEKKPDDIEARQVLEGAQTEQLEILATLLESHNAVAPRDPDRKGVVLRELYLNPHRFLQRSDTRGEHIPRSVLKAFLEGYATFEPYKEDPVAHNAMVLAGLAESRERELSKEKDALDELRTSGSEARVHSSARHARIGADAFAARSGHVNDVHVYEPAKMIEAIFENTDPKELEAKGVRMVRGLCADGLEFLAFWKGNELFFEYSRVLIDPKKHVRSEKADAAYASVPTISRADFERLDAMLLPLRAAHIIGSRTWHAARSYNQPGGKAKFESLFNDLRLTVASECPPKQVEILLRAHDTFVKTDESRFDELCGTFFRDVEAFLKEYRNSFVDRSAREIIDERLGKLDVKEVTFDQNFLKLLESLLEPSHYDKELSTCGAKHRVAFSSSQEHGVSYAQEDSMIRQLNIEKRPLMIVAGGAKNLVMEGAEGTQAEKMADELLRTAIEFKMNVLGPGTQSGLGLIIAKKIHAYRMSLPEDKRADAPRFIAVEPGKSTIVPGNPLIPTLTPEQLKHAYAGTAADMALTPHEAGWSGGQTMHTYQPHVDLRQGFANRIREGLPAIMVIGNGGKWTVQENAASAASGFPTIAVEDTGRFASLVSLAVKRRDQWRVIDTETAMTEFIRGLIVELPSEEDRTRVTQEFQSDDYREKAVDFFLRTREVSVESSSVGNLHQTLRANLLEQMRQFGITLKP